MVKTYFSGTEIFEYGDILLLEGGIALPKSSGEFDYRRYLAGKKIYAVCKIGKDGFIKKMGISRKPLVQIKKFLFFIKKRARDSILINLAPPHSSILAAMLLGDRQYLNRSIKDIFIKTGTMHILAISGLHVGIIVFIFLGLFKFVKIPERPSFIFTIILIFFYALMIAERPSVWRATLMAQLFLFGFILNRKPDFLNILSSALLILILMNPNYIFDAGFILSFACITSIIWISPALDGLFKVKSKRSSLDFALDRKVKTTLLRQGFGGQASQKSKVGFYILKSLSISISVWIGIMPLIAYYFRIITPITILANLVAIPICFVLVSLGVVALLFNPILPSLSIIFYETIWLANSILLSTLKFLSTLPAAFIKIKSFPIFYIFIYYAVLACLIRPVRKKIVTSL